MFIKEGYVYYNQWSSNTLEELATLIEENESVHTVYYNAMFEYEIGWELVKEDGSVRNRLNKVIKDRNIKSFIVVGSNNSISNFYNLTAHFYDSNTKIIHFATYFIYYTLNQIFGYSQKFREVGFADYSQMDKLYVTLNNKAHPHRCYMMDKLHENNLFVEGYLSWMEPDEPYEWRHWIPEKLILDYAYSKELDSFHHFPDEMYKSLFSLVAESTMDVPFITEKTFTPILCEKPILIWGPYGINKELEKWGFELYDELFDYSFDIEIDKEKRFEGLMNNIKALQGCDLQEKRNLVIDKIYRNKKRLLEIYFNNLYFPDVVAKFGKIFAGGEPCEVIIENSVTGVLDWDNIPSYRDYEVTYRDKPFFLNL